MSFQDRFKGFPEIETERLRLRELRSSEDAADWFRVASDLEVTKYLPWAGPKAVEEAEAGLGRLRGMFYDESYVLPWGIALKENDRLIGGIRYFAFSGHNYQIGEIGFELGREFWNRGFMTEAARSVVAFGFETVGLNRIQMTCHPDNIASARVAAKAGLQEEGLLRDWGYSEVTKSFRDLRMFAIVKREYAR